MTLRKRLRVILAALRQEWHEKTCGECGSTWMAVGKPTDLIAICDACELKEMERFTEEMNKRYPEALKGAEL